MKKIYLVFESTKKLQDKLIGTYSTRELALNAKSQSYKRYIVAPCLDVEYEDAMLLAEE